MSVVKRTDPSPTGLPWRPQTAFASYRGGVSGRNVASRAPDPQGPAFADVVLFSRVPRQSCRLVVKRSVTSLMRRSRVQVPSGLREQACSSGGRASHCKARKSGAFQMSPVPHAAPVYGGGEEVECIGKSAARASWRRSRVQIAPDEVRKSRGRSSEIPERVQSSKGMSRFARSPPCQVWRW